MAGPSRQPPSGLLLLLVCALLLLGGGGLLQWRATLLRDLDLQRRNGKHFEQMYHDSMEDSREWKAKYHRVKMQLEQNTLKLRELETANHDMAKQLRQSASEVSKMQERSQQERSEAEQLRSGAKNEEAAKREAQAHAEACEAQLADAVAGAKACRAEQVEASSRAEELQSEADLCRADLKQTQELLGHVESQLATVADDRDNMKKELDGKAAGKRAQQGAPGRRVGRLKELHRRENNSSASAVA
mmetsp:Transcript_21520/g.56112  ORF Transcript_21520/g.56112 Transcript_21520/m.56112 type:complete len:245 (+) Transcript_21520:156-890(+)